MTKRERTIGMVVGVAVALYAIDRVLVEPLLAAREDLSRQIETAKVQLGEDRNLVKQRSRFDSDWNNIIARGLVSDASKAQAQVNNLISQCLAETGVRFNGFNPDTTAVPIMRPSASGRSNEKDKNFLRISARFTGDGSLWQISAFLWRLQQSNIPIRINDLTIRSNTDATDDLKLQMGVSTIFLASEGTPAASTTKPVATTRQGEVSQNAPGTTRPTISSAASQPAPSATPNVNVASIEEQLRQRRLREQSGGAAPVAAPPASAPATQQGVRP